MSYPAELHNLMARAHLPARHVETTELHNEQWFRKFWLAQDTVNQNDSVLMLGRPGTGKTQMAVCVAMNLCRSLRKVRYYKAADMYGQAREALHNWSEQDALKRVAGPDLLIIDEAGQSRTSDYEQRTLFRVFDSRYDAWLPTIIISNQTRAELAKSIHPALVDRFSESATVIEPTWPTFRPEIGLAKRKAGAA